MSDIFYIRIITKYAHVCIEMYEILPRQNKMSAFNAQNPIQTCVWHGQKLTLHHTKNKKEEGSPDFLLF